MLLAARILNALDYVGVMGVELFVTPQCLIVNEIAPRVHNSGHWTQNGCAVDQFEQHIRAVAGWPLGPTAAHCHVEMTNLLGDEADHWAALAADSPEAQWIRAKLVLRSGGLRRGEPLVARAEPVVAADAGQRRVGVPELGSAERGWGGEVVDRSPCVGQEGQDGDDHLRFHRSQAARLAARRRG